MSNGEPRLYEYKSILYLQLVVPAENCGVCGLNSESKTHLSALYQEHRFVFIPHFISSSRAAELLACCEGLAVRRVICGIPGVSWDELSVERGHELYDFFSSEEVLNVLAKLLGLKRFNFARLTSWISSYRVGEYINPHRDRSGSIQVIVGLSALPEECGGTLILHPNENPATYFLGSGDCLIFEATSVEHCTSPILATPNYPEPRRIVAVARYFL
jgi:hypothetical protein